jgi:hypothetical protein
MKVELHEIMRSNKPKYKTFDVDRILAEHGHVTLHLPPYRLELNAIEKVWAVVKNWVAARNATFNLHDIKKLAEEKFSLVTWEEWLSVCNHLKEIEKNYIENERVLDNIADNLVITIGTSESNTDELDDDADAFGILPLSSDSD